MTMTATAPKYTSTQFKSQSLEPKNPHLKQPNFHELFTLGSVSDGVIRWEIMVSGAARLWKWIVFKREIIWICIMLKYYPLHFSVISLALPKFTFLIQIFLMDASYPR